MKHEKVDEKMKKVHIRKIRVKKIVMLKLILQDLKKEAKKVLSSKEKKLIRKRKSMFRSKIFS